MMDWIVLEKNVRAEFLLSYLNKKVANYIAFYRGDASKGYKGEVLKVDPNKYDNCTTVELARNGMMQILPDGLLFDKEDLDNPYKSTKDLLEKHKERKEKLELLFEPVDRRFFLLGMGLEEALSRIEPKLFQLLTDAVFDKNIFCGYDKDYSERLRSLLPGGFGLKGDLKMLALIAQNILGYNVNVEESGGEVQFTVIVDNLDAKGYEEKKKEFEPFFNQLQEWFMPYDSLCTYAIKSSKQHMKLGNGLLLNYNTKL